MSRVIPFTKMVAAGNDFIIVKTASRLARGSEWLARTWPTVAQVVCDRHYGIGADGLLVLEPSRIATVKMLVLNPDGSEAQMCGNGARCVAWYVRSKVVEGRRSPAPASPDSRETIVGASALGGLGKVKGKQEPVTIETAGGLVTAQVREDRVQLRMPDPRNLRLDLRVQVDHRPWQLAYVDTGVPHVVAIVDRLDQVDVERLGRRLRFHRAFRPRGTNVDFVAEDPRAPSRLRIRTYERGVEGETLACGTGVTAVAVVHALREDGAGRSRHRIDVKTKSGETLTVRLVVLTQGRTRRVTDVTLEGTVQRICQGVFPWPSLSHSKS